MAKVSTSKRIRSAAAVLGALLVVAACGSNGDSGNGDSGDGSSGGTTTIRMQLSWVPSAQFAGFLVASDKGFYSAAGLDVTILSGGPNVNNIQQIVSGSADMTVERTSTLFAARDKGVPIKAVAELEDQSGFWLIAKKSTGITEPSDLKGQKIGIYSDDEFEYDAMMAKMGLDPKTDVETFYQGFTMDPWLQDKYPVAQVTSWNELQTVYEAGVKPSDLTIFKPSDFGVGILHGCLIASESLLQDHADAVKAFVAATIKGWEYAYANPDEAVQIVLAAAPEGDSEIHEADQLQAKQEVQWPNGVEPADWGKIPMSTYEQNAKVVEDGGVVNGPVDVAAAVDLTIVP
jgi:NitT/TauT family transport system substrate-binding protein